VSKTLGEILAPMLKEHGLYRLDEAHSGYVDCLMEDGCTCRICVPEPRNFNTWMYKLSDAPESPFFCVAVWIKEKTAEFIDYDAGWSKILDVYDIKFVDNINDIVTRNLDRFKKKANAQKEKALHKGI
jgi:hypothetical protein